MVDKNFEGYDPETGKLYLTIRPDIVPQNGAQSGTTLTAKDKTLLWMDAVKSTLINAGEELSDSSGFKIISDALDSKAGKIGFAGAKISVNLIETDNPTRDLYVLSSSETVGYYLSKPLKLATKGMAKIFPAIGSNLGAGIETGISYVTGEFFELVYDNAIEPGAQNISDMVLHIMPETSADIGQGLINAGDFAEGVYEDGKELFTLLNKKQLSDARKIKYCDHIIVNEKNKKTLKKNLLDILKLYE